MFHPFTTKNHASTPDHFPSPFAKKPAPIAQQAAIALQSYLSNQTEWKHDFGIENPNSPAAMGKMFGVLVVRDIKGNLGYLCAFSGQLQGRQSHQAYFVPPVFNELKDADYCTAEYEAFSAFNKKIKQLESDPIFIKQQSELAQKEREHELLLDQQKKKHKKAREQRRAREKMLEVNQDHKALAQLDKKHLQLELNEKFLIKEYRNYLQDKLEALQSKVSRELKRIETLKTERVRRSRALGEWIFDHYHFLNVKGASKNVRELFEDNPPAAAGDCAAPKLLQYALNNQLKPIALAEFWWGKSNKLGDKEHGVFYPACEAKCRPILSYMLDQHFE